MSIAHSSSATARIRILGCDAAPPPRRRSIRRPIVIGAAVLVALSGVTVALTLPTSHPQEPAEPPVPVVAGTTIGVMGSAVPAIWHQNRHLHREMQAAVTTNLPAAARFAHRSFEPPATAVVVNATPVSIPSYGSSGPTGSSGSSSQTVVVGPELPPGPMNPGVAAP